jgi:hypothetical protein
VIPASLEALGLDTDPALGLLLEEVESKVTQEGEPPHLDALALLYLSPRHRYPILWWTGKWAPDGIYSPQTIAVG